MFQTTYKAIRFYLSDQHPSILGDYGIAQSFTGLGRGYKDLGYSYIKIPLSLGHNLLPAQLQELPKGEVQHPTVLGALHLSKVYSFLLFSFFRLAATQGMICTIIQPRGGFMPFQVHQCKMNQTLSEFEPFMSISLSLLINITSYTHILFG